jgi:hypothetical protein
MEQLKRRRHNHRNHKTLEEGVRKKQNHRTFRNRKMWRLFSTRRRGIQDTISKNKTIN